MPFEVLAPSGFVKVYSFAQAVYVTVASLKGRSFDAIEARTTGKVLDDDSLDLSGTPLPVERLLYWLYAQWVRTRPGFKVVEK